MKQSVRGTALSIFLFGAAFAGFRYFLSSDARAENFSIFSLSTPRKGSQPRAAYSSASCFTRW